MGKWLDKIKFYIADFLAVLRVGYFMTQNAE